MNMFFWFFLSFLGSSEVCASGHSGPAKPETASPPATSWLPPRYGGLSQKSLGGEWPSVQRAAKHAVLPQPAEAACAQKNIDVAVAASFDDVAHLFEPTNNDTLYLINFWATWCAPCVAELPFLEKVGDSYGGVPVKIVLMSLDFTKDSTKLCTFVSQNELRHPVVHLRDKKYNDWMPKVCESWEGAIPFSIALRGKKRLFHELEFEDTTAVEHFFEPLLKS